MPFTKFVEVGRVVFVAFGPNKGKVATIVDIIDQNRALIEGPKVERQSANFKRMQLTKFRLKFQHSASTHLVTQAWKDANMDAKWRQTPWAKKLKAIKTKENMNDFDRFKLMKAKQSRNKIIKREFGILKRKARRLAPKPKPKMAKKAPVKKDEGKKSEDAKKKGDHKKGDGKKATPKKGESKAPSKKAEGKAALPKKAEAKKAEGGKKATKK